MIKDNILSIKSDFIGSSPVEIGRGISLRARTRRLELNLTQAALASRSGVSLGTLKRFERYGEISLKNLLLLAVALKSTDGFSSLFSSRNYSTFEEAVSQAAPKKRKRGRIND
jgi:transcriptional regulator with XRE-family HTH domain